MGVDLIDAYGASVLLGGDRIVTNNSSAIINNESALVTADDSGRSTVSLEQFPVLSEEFRPAS